MEQEQKSKRKKNILYTIIAISVLLIAVSGVTYAYFGVGFTNNSDTKTTVTAVKANDVFTATGNDSLTLNVTSENMDNDDASDSYTSYTSDSTTLDVSLKAGSGTATCTYDLAIVSEGDTYTKTTGLGDLFEYTVQGKDTGSQKFAEINVDDALNSTMTAGESDETGTQVTKGILGHYKITDKYDSGDTQNATTQTWTITSKFYNLAHNQAKQLGKTYIHTVKVVNVKCTNNNEVKESDVKVVSGDTDTIGSEIAIGDEHFYVISSDDTSVTMLAKYNLLVGENYFYYLTEESCANAGYTWNSSKEECNIDEDAVEITSSTPGYNLQSSIARGEFNTTYTIFDSDDNEIATYTDSTKQSVFSSLTTEQISKISYIDFLDYSGFTNNATIKFAVNNIGGTDGSYWIDSSYALLPKYGTTYPAWVYDDNSIIYKYVENYKTLLENKYTITIDEARLMKNEELTSLGCNNDNRTCITANIINNNRTWVFDTQYWTGSSVSSVSIWCVSTNGKLEGRHADETNGGVRPVITIAKNLIE